MGSYLVKLPLEWTVQGAAETLKEGLLLSYISAKFAVLGGKLL